MTMARALALALLVCCVAHATCESAHPRRLNSCGDGIKNNNETDVDCGGVCSTKCAVGSGCESYQDCSSGLCGAGVCFGECVCVYACVCVCVCVSAFMNRFAPDSACQVSAWSSFSSCTATCGAGTKLRTRTVVRQHGSCNLELTETQDCNQALCGMSCALLLCLALLLWVFIQCRGHGPGSPDQNSNPYVAMTVTLHGLSSAGFSAAQRDAFRSGVGAATSTSVCQIRYVRSDVGRHVGVMFGTNGGTLCCWCCRPCSLDCAH